MPKNKPKSTKKTSEIAPKETAPEETVSPETALPANDIDSEAGAVSPEDASDSGANDNEATEELPDIVTSWERLGTRLGPEFVHGLLEYVVRNIPTGELWKLLNTAKYYSLQTRVTKGFQRTATTLRQTPVRNRLVKEMAVSSTLTFHLLKRWTDTSPLALKTIHEINDEDAITEQLPHLWKKFGTETLFWSLFVERHQNILDAWAEKLANGETFAPEETTEENAEQLPCDDVNTEPKKVRAPTIKIDKLLADANTATAKWQTRAEVAELKLRTAEAALLTERSENSKQVQELRATARQEENRYTLEHQKLLEIEKTAERSLRKLKSTEKQLEELEAENKRLKKQVRQQQELNEELKKEAAGLRAKIEGLEKAAQTPIKPVQTPSPAPERPSLPGTLRFFPTAPTVAPQEQQFIWDADGHTIRVTPRDIKRAIDRNDENFVFALIQATDALRQTSGEGFKMLLDRLRDYDRYYARVLTEHTTRILVDASNVARYEKNRFGKGQIRFLLAMRQELRMRNCFPIRFIADASLPYNIDSPEELMAMVKRNELELSPARQEADEILAREARRSGAFVVSNDRTFHHKVSPGFEPPRVGFQFYDAYVVVDEF